MSNNNPNSSLSGLARTALLQENTGVMSWAWMQYIRQLVSSAPGSAIQSPFSVTGLDVFANNAAAVAGGLRTGNLYRTGADPDVVCVVH